jgi:thiol-disulfide isomerase/thioredoxin
MDFLIRAGLAFAIIVGGCGLYLLYNRLLSYRARGLLTDLGPLRPNAFTLVYFTTSTCVPCKTIQRPAIEKLIQDLGNALNVIEIDATEKPTLASRWGVMSVPTTFVINPRGELLHVNHGVTRAEKLLVQLHSGK